MSVDGRALGGPEPRVVYALQQARRRRLDRARHARPPDRRRARARERAAAVSGRAPRRRQQRPDPADQRRRARQPAHPSALRGARRPTARASAAARSASAALRRAARAACELEDGPTAPARARRLRGARRRDRADDPRGPQPPGAADVRGGRAPGARAAARSRFGPLRSTASRPAAHRRLSAAERRRALRDAARSDTIARHATVRPARRRSASKRNDAQDILERDHRADARRSWSATRSRREDVVSCIFTATHDLNAEFPAVAARALGFDRVPLLCAREIPVPGSLPRVIRVLIHYYAEDATCPPRLPRRGRGAARRPAAAQ